jgi:asparagine synthase (glutamine-hydrolysing)
MAGLRGGGQESLLRSLAAQTDNRDDPLFSHRARFGMGQFAERLLVEPSHDAEPRLLEELVDLYPGLASASPVGKAQVLEYETLLEGYLLSSQGDRMTTAHGVEARCAFLDHGLVDFAFSLPEEFKLKDGVNEKYLLKAAFADLVPPSIVSRPKQPYRAPDCRAFLQHAGEDWIAAAISPERVKASGLFKPDVVERFIGRLKTLPPAAISPREDQAFMLLMSTLLLKSQFVDNFSMAELTDVGTFAVFEDQRR